ncbi:MAG: hypothetical protein WCK65_08150 [Rhodospirillaceae bacterium]
MTHTSAEIVELIADPICRQLMTRDGIKPTDVFNMLRTVHPIIGGKQAVDPPPPESDVWSGSPDRRDMLR